MLKFINVLRHYIQILINLTFNFDKNSRISPDLLNANPLEKRMAYLRRNGSDRDVRMQMVFNDLLRISICSAVDH